MESVERLCRAAPSVARNAGSPPLLSWLIAKMLDGQHKMEEAADTSSAGPLEACLFPDYPN